MTRTRMPRLLTRARVAPNPCTRLHHWWRDQRGQTLPFIGLMLLVLLGMVALIIDGGMIYAAKRKMQNAADAAVLAAGTQFAEGLTDDATVLNMARGYALLNTAITATVRYVDADLHDLGPVGAGAVPAGASGVRVVASRTVQPSIGALFGMGPVTVSGTATGRISAASGDAVIITLKPTACPGLTLTGSGLIRTVNGGIWDNATCSEALRQTGSSDIEVVVDVESMFASINVVGGFRRVGSGTTTPWPTTGAAPIADPLAGVPPPIIANYPVQYGSPAAPTLKSITGSGSATLNAGVYYGGIRVTGSGNVTFNPGVYIIAGGQLSLIGSGTVIADGVLFYITNDPAQPTGNGAYAAVSITGSGASRFRPMSSGVYRNLTFFQDRANTKQASITGSGAMFGGTYYFPTADLKFSGSGNLSGYMQLIAASMTMTGSGNMIMTYDNNKVFAVWRASLGE